jgi:methylglyoxal synthase
MTSRKMTLLSGVILTTDPTQYCLYATGTTGKRTVESTGLEINLLKSGSYGGDMQLGGLIADGKMHCLIFF